MLHELLFALNGFPGDICTYFDKSESSADRKGLRLLSDRLPFITPSETLLVSQLLLLAEDYIKLKIFIDRFKIPHASLYITALARGLDNILEDYRSTLCTVEQSLLCDASCGLTFIFFKVYSFKPLLSSLATLLEKVMRQITPESTKTFSKQCLLDIIIQVANTSFPSLKPIFRHLAACQMRVLYSQLSGWLLYGVLVDPFGEFFVQPVSRSPDSDTAQCSQTTDLSPDERPTSDMTEAPAERRFELCTRNLPSIISPSMANDVLYAGQVVSSFAKLTGDSSSSKCSLSISLGDNFSERFVQQAQNLFCPATPEDAPLVDIDSLQSMLHDILLFISSQVHERMFKECNLPHHLNMLRDILLMSRGELFLTFFDNLRREVDSEFSMTIALHRNYKRSGNYMNRDLLDRPTPSNILEAQGLTHAVNRAFLTAARAVGLNDEELEKRFRFSLSTNPVPHCFSPDTESPVAWDCLQVHYSPPPGLETVFNPSACETYTRLFQFLLTLRRTEQDLHQYWARETTGRRANRYVRPPVLSPKTADEGADSTDQHLLVVNQMAFIVDHLNCYLQVDVIAAQFDRLMRCLRDQQFLGSVEALHETYLAGLQAQAFLLHPIVNPCLTRLLAVCRKFVRLNQQPVPGADGDAGDGHLSSGGGGDGVLSPWTVLRAEFEHLAFVLFTSLSSARTTSSRGIGMGIPGPTGGGSCSSQTGGHLAQLLLRLDFNRFFGRFASEGS
ncbi:Gamma-tubulin complex component 4 [Sparganum proliferum]